jgi:hypothetical protein
MVWMMLMIWVDIVIRPANEAAMERGSIARLIYANESLECAMDRWVIFCLIVMAGRSTVGRCIRLDPGAVLGDLVSARTRVNSF